MIRLATIAILFLIGVFTVFEVVIAQQSLAPTTQSDLEEDSFDRLSKNKYSRRQQATLEMWRQRDASREQVQQAAEHPDPEVSGRAKWILRQWRRGSLPDTPPEISRLLQQSKGALAVERLLEGGQFTAVIVAIEEAAGAVDRAAIEQRISAALLRRFPIYVHHAVAGESLPDLLSLIDMVASTKGMAVCRIQLMQQMGIDLETVPLLPASSKNWSPIQRQRTMALLLMILGKVDEAVEVAKQSVDEDLLRKCRMIASRWQEAARDAVMLAREAEVGTHDHVRLWCLTLIAADRANDREMFDEAVAALASEEASEEESAAELRWKSLASHGEIDKAFTILDRVNRSASASVSIDASRTARAFEALGFPLDRVDSELDQWIDTAIENQRISETNELSDAVRQVLALMQCLIAVGRDETAWQIAERLSDSDVHISSLRLREWVLSTLTMTKRSDWIIALALREGETSLTIQSRSAVATTLSDASSTTLENVMRALSKVKRGLTPGQQLRGACLLLEGELPEGFTADDFPRLYEELTRPVRRRLRGRPVGQPVNPADLDTVRLLARHGQADLANECLKGLVEGGDLEALFYLAEQELDGGRSETALELFQTLYETVENEGRRSGKIGTSGDTVLAVQALIGIWVVARRSGDDQWSAELEREIRLGLCSPSTQMRNAIAEYLGQRGDDGMAMEAYNVLLPMTVFGSEEKTGLYDVARSYSLLARRSDPVEAARWFDLAVGASLDAMSFRPGAYVTLPLYVRRWAIESAIEQKDLPEVQRHLDRILKLDPLDIDFAERLLPAMREAGMDEIADHALDQIMDEGVRYAESFPFDAMSSNNLAWVAAMNRRRLDDALKLSEMAVYAEPDSAIYRDTLAEVLFQLDRKREALQIEQACLLDDPSQWHLHQQIAKYSEAVEQSEP